MTAALKELTSTLELGLYNLKMLPLACKAILELSEQIEHINQGLTRHLGGDALLVIRQRLSQLEEKVDGSGVKPTTPPHSVDERVPFSFIIYHKGGAQCIAGVAYAMDADEAKHYKQSMKVGDQYYMIAQCETVSKTNKEFAAFCAQEEK